MLVVIGAWFLVAILVDVWIPAFAGMTAGVCGWDSPLAIRAWFLAAVLVDVWIPAFAGMTEWNKVRPLIPRYHAYSLRHRSRAQVFAAS